VLLVRQIKDTQVELLQFMTVLVGAVAAVVQVLLVKLAVTQIKVQVEQASQ
jgi:hypothetical protein